MPYKNIIDKRNHILSEGIVKKYLDKKKENKQKNAMDNKVSGICAVNWDIMKKYYIDECNKKTDILQLEALKSTSRQKVAEVEIVIKYLKAHPEDSHCSDLPKLKSFVSWYKNSFIKMIDKKIGNS